MSAIYRAGESREIDLRNKGTRWAVMDYVYPENRAPQGAMVNG